MICNDCPRHCGVDRKTSHGVCGVGEKPRVAKAYLHMWEEPVITGSNGSGCVFFSGCNLKCVYCQNYKISSECVGKEITVERLAEIFHELEDKGATNINLVSPSHYVRAIKSALDIYRPNIPIVYNSNGYDSIESLEYLKGYIDIFLMDFKYMDSNLSKEYSKASDYPEVAMSNLKKAREICPQEIIENGVMKKGLLIRHLVLPGHTNDSIAVLRWIKDNISNPFISLMCQYTPTHNSKLYSDLSRPLKPIEYKRVVREMEKLSLYTGYLQEFESISESFIPAFDCQGV